MNVVFLHVAKINNYQEILDEILSCLMKIIDKIDKIYLAVLGIGDLTLPENSKIEVVYSLDNIEEGEMATLDNIREYAINNENCNILYLHLKGVTDNSLNKCLSDWREYMLYFCVEKIDACLELLKNNDTCGVDLRDIPTKHYSGNFWWAKSDYIKTLPPVSSLPLIISERHKSEFWICSQLGSHVGMWDCGINVYERHMHRYTPDKYKR